MSHVLLVQGDARHVPLAEKSVHMILTSPPYFGLRSYGIGVENGEIGGESLHDCNGWATGHNCQECYLCHLRQVFAEVWRVLRDEGTCWIVIGDSYNATGRNGHGASIGEKQRTNRASSNGQDNHRPSAPSLKPKDLCGIPQRLALALQAEGWIWRSEIIWDKKNPMPESVHDRPTRSHEQVLMFSKQARYFYDDVAIAEPGASSTLERDHYPRPPMYHEGNSDPKGGGFRGSGGMGCYVSAPNRNARSVWSIATEPTTLAHFATMPSALVRRAIRAGTSEYGVCSICGNPWQRETERTFSPMTDRSPEKLARGSGHKGLDSSRGDSQTPRGYINVTTTGWLSTCACDNPARVAAVVFDPFVGSGTTIQVALEEGRHGIGTDLSLPYLRDSAQRRIATAYAQPGLFEPRQDHSLTHPWEQIALGLADESYADTKGAD